MLLEVGGVLFFIVLKIVLNCFFNKFLINFYVLIFNKKNLKNCLMFDILLYKMNLLILMNKL